MRGINLSGLLLVIGLVAGPTSGRAQSPVRLGVQGGLNFATFAGQEAGGAELISGWQLGGVALLGRGALALMPGAVLTRKGATQSNQVLSSRLTLTYLQVPLLARIALSDAGSTGSIGAFAFAGPAAR